MDKEGESGILYKVYSKRDDKPRIVKVYKDPIDNVSLRLYLADSKKLMKHKDDKIIQAFETGRLDIEGEKFFFIILEYIEGKSLDEIPEHLYWEKNSYNERINLFNQVLSAIEIFRKEYDLHNDLHLGNIMITVNNKVKIIDFGSSKESYDSAELDLDLYLIKKQLMGFFLKPDEIADLTKSIKLEKYNFNQLKQLISERIERIQDSHIEGNHRDKAFVLLKKVENVNTKLTEILPEYLEYLYEIKEHHERIWVTIEISGNIYKYKKKHRDQLKYREILSYLSNSSITYPGNYTIERIVGENPDYFHEHKWIADYTMQELEEISVHGDTQILVGYYNQEGLEFYNYTSISALKQILTRIRKKISEFLLTIINSEI